MMTLYFSPGACALASQITLREAGFNFNLVRVDLKAKQSSEGDFWAVNPKGYVPALRLEDGSVLTEGAVILQWIADQKPEKNLLPKLGTMERYRAQEWLNFIASELHKGFGTFFNDAVSSNETVKQSLFGRLGGRVDFVNKHLAKNKFLLGSEFSAADAYLFNILRWAPAIKFDLTPYPALMGFMENMLTRPTVQAALEGEGLTRKG